MAGNKEGSKKRVATIYMNEMMSGKPVGSTFAKWGSKGGKLTTGGFHNMKPDKLKETSAKGVEARRKNRGEDKN